MSTVSKALQQQSQQLLCGSADEIISPASIKPLIDEHEATRSILIVEASSTG
jgi:hypothetical protein